MKYWAPVRIGNMLAGVAEITWEVEPSRSGMGFNAKLDWYDHTWLVDFNDVNEMFYGSQVDARNYFETRENMTHV